MATFSISMSEFISRLRLPKDVSIKEIDIEANDVIFTVDGDGALELVEVPYQRTETMTWHGHEPRLIPAKANVRT